MRAGIDLLRQVGAEVPAAAALIELTFLGGRQRLDIPCETRWSRTIPDLIGSPGPDLVPLQI